MQVVSESAEGLVHRYTVRLDRAEIGAATDKRLTEIGKTAKVPGFRPGKIPMPMLRSRYGASVTAEVLEKLVGSTSDALVAERKLRPALKPRIEVTKFDQGSDLEYALTLEVLPEFEPAPLAELEIERLTAEVDSAALEEGLTKLAARTRSSERIDEARPAVTGDVLLIDFTGTVDGVSREGMSATDFELELGGNTLVPGFEAQLDGVSAGETRTVTVTFPDDYVKDLAGKVGVFEVTVKELRRPAPAAIDDALAKKYGKETLDELRTALRDQIAGEWANTARLRLKRTVLDRLAERHDFPVPPGMVGLEFDSIWKQVQQEIAQGQIGPEDKDKPIEQLQGEYRAIAERRVRLGLVLTEIGRRHAISVSRDELGQALIREVRRYPGQEREAFEFFRNNPAAQDRIRAPLFEDKVIDFILTQAKVTDRSVSYAELVEGLDLFDPAQHSHIEATMDRGDDHDHDHGHVHGPDCDHDHDHAEPGHVHGPGCGHDHHHHD